MHPLLVGLFTLLVEMLKGSLLNFRYDCATKKGAHHTVLEMVFDKDMENYIIRTIKRVNKVVEHFSD